MIQKENTSVPNRRFFALQVREKRIDLGAAFEGEVPRPRHVRKIQPIDVGNQWRLTHDPSASASNTRLGFVISSCAATNWISRAPTATVFASTPNTLEAARDSASPTLPLRR